MTNLVVNSGAAYSSMSVCKSMTPMPISVLQSRIRLAAPGTLGEGTRRLPGGGELDETVLAFTLSTGHFAVSRNPGRCAVRRS